jgi:hypothetical protein
VFPDNPEHLEVHQSPVFPDNPEHLEDLHHLEFQRHLVGHQSPECLDNLVPLEVH